MTDLEYANRLLDSGVEMYLDHNGKLRLYPKGAFRHRLTAWERGYWCAHRDTLAAMVLEGKQPRLPDEQISGGVGTKTTIIGGVTAVVTSICPSCSAPNCPYCQRACVGPDHPSYRLFHWNDPAEVAARAARHAQRNAFDRQTWHLHEVLSGS